MFETSFLKGNIKMPFWLKMHGIKKEKMNNLKVLGIIVILRKINIFKIYLKNIFSFLLKKHILFSEESYIVFLFINNNIINSDFYFNKNQINN
jgi:effector-binding domain-containing protein